MSDSLRSEGPQTVAFFDLLIFVAKWHRLLLVCAVLGAVFGVLFARYIRPAEFDTEVLVETKSPGIAVLQDVKKVNEQLASAKAQPSLARAFAKSMVEAIEADAAAGTTTSDSSAKALAYLQSMFDGPAGAAKEPKDRVIAGLGNYLADSSLQALRGNTPRTGFLYSITYDETSSWRVTLRTRVAGVADGLVKASGPAISSLATMYNEHQISKRKAVLNGSAENATVTFNKFLGEMLSLKTDYEMRRNQLRVNFYQVYNRIGKLDSGGLNNNKSGVPFLGEYISSLVGRVTPMSGDLRQGVVANATIDILDSFDSNVVSRRLANIADQPAGKTLDFNSFYKELSDIETEKSSLNMAMESRQRHLFIAQDNMVRAVTAAATMIETADFALPLAEFDLDAYESQKAFRKVDQFSTSLALWVFAWTLIGVIFGGLVGVAFQFRKRFVTIAEEIHVSATSSARARERVAPT